MATRTLGGPLAICIAAGAALLLAVGCSSSTRGPGGALDAYSNALGKRDYAAAYKLMSDSFRERHSKEEFIAMMDENPREVGETAARLRSPRREMTVSAQLTYGSGDRLKLIQEGGKWRVDSNPIQFYSQATPREALRSFLRAYRLKRWDIMLRFIPNAYRKLMDEQKLQEQFEGDSREDIDSIMHKLEASIDAEIQDNGSEARMTYGDGEVEFIREEDLWKIQDID